MILENLIVLLSLSLTNVMLTFRIISKYKSRSKAIKCFILSFKNEAALLYKSHIIISTVTPTADLDATNRAHQPQVDRSGWNTQSREQALLLGVMSARSPPEPPWPPISTRGLASSRGHLEHEWTPSTRPQATCPSWATVSSAAGW